MDLEELRAFVAVAETGSSSAAADALGVSRTTLRRKIDALEARAGVALLEATPRGIVLTDAGRARAEQGRRMIQEMRAVLSSVRELGASPRGVLRLVLPVGMPPHVLTPIAGALRASFPALSLDVRFSDDPIREALDDVDVAIHFGASSPGSAWLSPALFPIRHWLVASPVYLERRGTPADVDGLAAHELFTWRAPQADPGALPLRRGGHARVEAALVSTDPHMLRALCHAGLGIAFLPDGLMPDPDVATQLVSVLPDDVGRDDALYVSVPKVLAEVPKIRVILERVRGFLGGQERVNGAR